jgi:hypothetical protein
MIIQEEDVEYTKCEHCGSRISEIVTPEIRGCDNCGKVFDPKLNNIDISVFNDYGGDIVDDHKDYEFCSWKCFFDKIKDIPCNYFMSLRIIFDRDDKCEEGGKGIDFVNLVKNIK